MNHSSSRPLVDQNATLLLLPPEIQQAIFSQVDNVRTFKAAAASCHSLRDLLLHSNLVINQVLMRVIPPDLLPEAFAVYKSSRLPSTNRGIVQDFLHDYFTSLSHISHFWTLNEAASLEQFHELVQLFTTDFVARALSKNPVTGSPEKSEPALITERELYRIQRAFYRFELYCNLFKRNEKCRNPIRPPPLVIPFEDQSRLFFHRFAPWENEQLACIHDFLLRVIDEPYDDVAAHDVDWGESEVPYHEGYKPGCIGIRRKHYLSLGLGFIHRLRTTKEYESRLHILDASSGSQCYFLDGALLRSNMSRDSVPLSAYDQERLEREVRPPAIIDADGGPAEVWRVTHLGKPGQKFVMANSHIPLRECGYVMWDFERLANWGMLKTPWQPIPPRPYAEVREIREKVRRSHERRSEIWIKGGSGWWSEQDESKVVYTPVVGTQNVEAPRKPWR